MGSKKNGTIKWINAYWKMIRSHLKSPKEIEFNDRTIFSLTSDFHCGHADCDEPLIQKYFMDAINYGVRTHFIVGDVVESAYNLKLPKDIGEKIVYEQIEGLKKSLPEVENNKYYVVLGNHDIHAASFLIDRDDGKISYKGAAEIFRELLDDRTDIEVMGAGFVRVKLNNRYTLDLIHPKGNNGECITKYADHYISKAVKKGFDPPNLVDFGHYHTKKLLQGNYSRVMQNGSALKRNNGNGNGFGWVVEFGRGINGKDTMLIHEYL